MHLAVFDDPLTKSWSDLGKRLKFFQGGCIDIYPRWSFYDNLNPLLLIYYPKGSYDQEDED